MEDEDAIVERGERSEERAANLSVDEEEGKAMELVVVGNPAARS